MSTPLRAMAWMLLATIAFSVTHAMVRVVSSELHAFEILFFRNFFGFLPLLPWLWRYRKVALRTARPGLQFMRIVFDLVSLVAFYVALTLTPLARVTALSFTAPVFATALAALLLRERVGWRRWSAVLVGFAGTVLAVRPNLDGIDTGAMLMLVSSVLVGGVILAVKILTRSDSTLTITAYFLLLSMPLSLVPALFVWQWPSSTALFYLAAIGVITTLGMLGFTAAIRVADTHVIMPLDFLRLIWSAAIGWLLFAEQPHMLTWMGGGLIIASATYIGYWEYVLGRAARFTSK